MDFGIAVDFAGGRLQDFCAAALGQAEHANGTEDGRFDGLDRIVLIVAWCGGTSEIVDFVDFQKERMDNIVTEQLEIWTFEQMNNVGFLAGEEIIGADDIVARIDEPLAQMRAQKARSAGH